MKHIATLVLAFLSLVSVAAAQTPPPIPPTTNLITGHVIEAVSNRPLTGEEDGVQMFVTRVYQNPAYVYTAAWTDCWNQATINACPGADGTYTIRGAEATLLGDYVLTIWTWNHKLVTRHINVPSNGVVEVGEIALERFDDVWFLVTGKVDLGWGTFVAGRVYNKSAAPLPQLEARLTYFGTGVNVSSINYDVSVQPVKWETSGYSQLMGFLLVPDARTPESAFNGLVSVQRVKSPGERYGQTWFTGYKTFANPFSASAAGTR